MRMKLVLINKSSISPIESFQPWIALALAYIGIKTYPKTISLYLVPH